MAVDSVYSGTIHPLHAVLVAGTASLLLSAALSDAAYAATYEIQWLNFAAWLIVGSLILAGIALIFTIVDLSRPQRRAEGVMIYALVLLATWVASFFDALMHTRDAYGSMPVGLVLSIIAAVLACVATWLGFATPRIRRVR